MRRKWGDVGPGPAEVSWHSWPQLMSSWHRSGTTIALTRRYLQLRACVFVNWPSPVDHQKLTRGPGRLGIGVWWTVWSVECGQQLNNWLRSILVTPGPWPHATAGENVEMYSFLIYFTNIPPRGSILPQLIRGAERGWDWESDFHQIKAWHSSYSRPG